MTRRGFLHSLGFTTASLFTSGNLTQVFGAQRLRTRPEHPVLADLHNHAMMDKWVRITPIAQKYPLMASAILATANPSGVDWAESHAAGVDLVCVPHYNVFDELMSMPTDPFPHARDNAIHMMDQLEAQLDGPAKPYAQLARNRDELARRLAVPKSSGEFRVAVVHALEGSHALGGEIEALDGFAHRSVAYITITHFLDNGLSSASNALPFFPDAGSPPPSRGLSEFGREVIQEMERKGIIVDVPHMSSTALEDALRVTSRPLLASHTGSRTLCDRPYTLPDEHVLEIARRGGLLGVVLFPYHLSNYGTFEDARAKGSVHDVVRTVRHWVKIGGTHKHIGIGTDFGGFITPPRGLSHHGSIHVLREALLAEFGDANVVEDIMANNAIRFLLENWGART